MYVLLKVKNGNFTESDFSKDLTLKNQVYKNISRYYNKDFKIKKLR